MLRLSHFLRPCRLPTGPRPLAAWLACWLLGCWLVTSTAVAHAQQVRPGRQQVAEILRRLAEQLQADQLVSSESRRREVDAAYRAVRSHLEETAAQANAAAWRAYIGWEDLAAQSDSPAEDARRITELRNVYWRLARNLPGLERSPLTLFRQRMRQYVTRLEIGEGEAAAQRLRTGLRSIADALADPDEPLTARQWADIGFYIPYLQATGIEPAAVARLRQHFDVPSVQICVGEAIIAEVSRRPVFRLGNSDECILGTRVLSDTRLDARLTAQLLPSRRGAKILLDLSGDFSSRGTGYQKKVRVFNRTWGDVSALQELTITSEGISAGPARSTARLQTEVLGISHPLALVRRIATRKAAQQRGQATRIAESRLEGRLSNQFSEGVEQQLNEDQLFPEAIATDIADRLDLFTPELRWSSTDELLRVRFTSSNDYQISTDTLPPPVSPGRDVVVQVHEAAVQSVTTWVLGGRRLLDTELENFARELIPAELRQTEQSAGTDSERSTGAITVRPVDDSEEPIEILFANRTPLVLGARADGIEIGLYGQFRQGDRQVVPLRISTVFEPIREQGRVVRLQRDVDVKIVDPQGQRSLARTAVKSAVKARFEERFPQSIEVEPLKLPVVDPSSGVQYRILTLRDLRTRGGWITATFALRSQ